MYELKKKIAEIDYTYECNTTMVDGIKQEVIMFRKCRRIKET